MLIACREFGDFCASPDRNPSLRDQVLELGDAVFTELGRSRSLLGALSDDALGPRSLFAFGGAENFGVIRIEPSTLSVRIVDADGQERGSHTAGPER